MKTDYMNGIVLSLLLVFAVLLCLGFAVASSDLGHGGDVNSDIVDFSHVWFIIFKKDVHYLHVEVSSNSPGGSLGGDSGNLLMPKKSVIQ